MITKIIFLIFTVLLILNLFNDYKLERKVERLISKVENLSVIANIECKYPNNESTDEFKIVFLENQLRNLEFLILNRNHQDKDLRYK